MLAPNQAWPPDYKAVTDKRAELLLRIKLVPGLLNKARNHYANNGAQGCIDFIEDWVDTFDPRNAGTSRPTRMPFILFKRQKEAVEFLWACYQADANGLIEKSRDMGATWICCAFSVWVFLFQDGADIGWGSRKADSVDALGNMSSIFEKMRYIMRTLPLEFWPSGFSEDTMHYMRMYSPEKGNSIIGESGDEIGRGGRTKMTIKDESAHYEHPELIEAALGDNTRVQIDLSSVSGLGTVFHRKREAGVEWNGGPAIRGVTNVLVMDWSDHPDKTQEWYNTRRAEASANGLLHIFKQEVDRDYAGAVEGVIIPAEWVKSAIDAHIKLKFTEGKGDALFAALDVADGGGDTNALVHRKGVVLKGADQWGERDTGVTTRRAVEALRGLGRKGRRVLLQYDSVGVGAGVKAESNRLIDDDLMPPFVAFVSWSAGAGVLNPDDHMIPEDYESPLNKDFYQNLKAQGWWQLRLRFERTHRAVTEGIKYDQDQLISIPSNTPHLRTIQKELSQATIKKFSTTMKLQVDKQPDGAKSPNFGDSIMMCYWPVDPGYDSSMGWV